MGLGGKRYGKNSTWGEFPKFIFEDLPNFDVGLYYYRTLFGRFNKKKSISIEQEAKIFADIIRDELSHYESIILLGHSMGGLLCKACISQLIVKKDHSTLSKIAGLFLLATPQLGSIKVWKPLSHLSSDFKVLRAHNQYITQVSSTLEDNLYTHKSIDPSAKIFIPTWAILAGEDFWVDELSAGIGLNSSQKKIVRGSHTEIVKPKNKTQDGMYSWVKSNIEQCAKRYKFDVFIAAAMAGHDTDEEYQKSRNDVLLVIKQLEEKCNVHNIYYAGQKLKSKKKFEAKSLSLEIDMNALRSSRYFLLLYPQKLVSSVLFEAGIALALGIPSVYFVKDRKNLPFLMEQAGQADIKPGVKIYECNDIDTIINYIDRHKDDLWKAS